MSNFKERLMEFVKSEYGEGQQSFEKRCGLSNGLINKMDNGTSTSTLAKIAEVCPQLNLRWLILGVGEMLEETQTNTEDVRGIELRPTNDIHGNNNVFIANWGELKDVIREVLKEKQI